MGSTNRKRALIVSAAIILLALTIIVGMTWSLFTDTQGVTNHLKAGDLEITLTRKEFVKTTLNQKGYLETLKPDTTPVDFSDPTSANVFGITTNANGEMEKIVPGSKFVAKMEIANKSDVAFGYWIEIVCTDKTKGPDLAKQLRVTVNTGTDKYDFVGNGLIVKGASGGYIDVLGIGDTDTFTVTVEFLDSYVSSNGLGYNDNDKAQSEELKFDLVVHAVQSTNAR